MKSPEAIREALRERDLEVLAESVAIEHGVPLDEILSGSRRREVTDAWHAVLAKLCAFFDGNQSAVARLVGVDPSSVSYAISEAPREIRHVVLAIFEVPGHRYVFAWWGGRRHPFGIVDEAIPDDEGEWFGPANVEGYHLAHARYSELCERAGQPTFRSHAVPAEARLS